MPKSQFAPGKSRNRPKTGLSNVVQTFNSGQGPIKAVHSFFTTTDNKQKESSACPRSISDALNKLALKKNVQFSQPKSKSSTHRL